MITKKTRFISTAIFAMAGLWFSFAQETLQAQTGQRQPMSPGRMNTLADRINDAPEGPKPLFQIPEWMKLPEPAFPALGKRESSQLQNNPLSRLPKPKWLGGEGIMPQGNGTFAPPKTGFLSNAEKSFETWRKQTGSSIQAANQNLRAATSDAWNNLFGQSNSRQDFSSPDGQESSGVLGGLFRKNKAVLPPAQPPLRSAENWNDRTPLRIP